MKKPSVKIIVLIMISLIVIILAALNRSQVEPDATKAELQDNVYASDANLDTYTESNIAALDTDGDGLPDWQEILTNTDPRNSDTDGDGTSDSRELEFGRDPTIAGPDDQREKTSLNSENPTDPDTESTISEEVSKNLFANAVFLSNNDSLTEDNVNTLVDNLIGSVQNTFTYKEYLPSNLKIAPYTNKDSIRFYASVFANLQLGLLDELSTTQEMKALGDIYIKHASDLYALDTPAEVSSIVIQIINNFSKVSSVFYALDKQSEDPLKLPLAVKAYQETSIEQPILIQKIAEFLDKNDIINSLDESTSNYWDLALTQ